MMYIEKEIKLYFTLYTFIILKNGYTKTKLKLVNVKFNFDITRTIKPKNIENDFDIWDKYKT